MVVTVRTETLRLFAPLAPTRHCHRSLPPRSTGPFSGHGSFVRDSVPGIPSTPPGLASSYRAGHSLGLSAIGYNLFHTGRSPLGLVGVGRPSQTPPPTTFFVCRARGVAHVRSSTVSLGGSGVSLRLLSTPVVPTPLRWAGSESVVGLPGIMLHEGYHLFPCETSQVAHSYRGGPSVTLFFFHHDALAYWGWEVTHDSVIRFGVRLVAYPTP